MPENNHIPELISKLRERFSEEEIANSIGVTLMTIWRWQNKRAKPHRIFLRKLLKLQKTKT